MTWPLTRHHQETRTLTRRHQERDALDPDARGSARAAMCARRCAPPTRRSAALLTLFAADRSPPARRDGSRPSQRRRGSGPRQPAGAGPLRNRRGPPAQADRGHGQGSRRGGWGGRLVDVAGREGGIGRGRAQQRTGEAEDGPEDGRQKEGESARRVSGSRGAEKNIRPKISEKLRCFKCDDPLECDAKSCEYNRIFIDIASALLRCVLRPASSYGVALWRVCGHTVGCRTGPGVMRRPGTEGRRGGG